MEKISRKEILDLPEYEKIRRASLSRIIALKKRRRAALGDRVTLVFENRDTVISLIQEMMRAERIHDEGKVLEEIEIYNPLLPDPGEISATLFIEITESERIPEEMERFRGIDGGEALFLQVGDQKVPGRFETGRSTEEKLSAVHYVRFPLAPVLAPAEDGRGLDHRLHGEELRLILSLPGYQAAAVIGPQLKEELLRDLTEAVSPA